MIAIQHSASGFVLSYFHNTGNHYKLPSPLDMTHHDFDPKYINIYFITYSKHIQRDVRLVIKHKYYACKSKDVLK